MSVGFYLDQSRCTGCRACQVVCKDKNRLEVGTLYREAHSYTVGEFPKVQGFSYTFSEAFDISIFNFQSVFLHQIFFDQLIFQVFYDPRIFFVDLFFRILFIGNQQPTL